MFIDRRFQIRIVTNQQCVVEHAGRNKHLWVKQIAYRDQGRGDRGLLCEHKCSSGNYKGRCECSGSGCGFDEAGNDTQLLTVMTSTMYCQVLTVW